MALMNTSGIDPRQRDQRAPTRSVGHGADASSSSTSTASACSQLSERDHGLHLQRRRRCLRAVTTFSSVARRGRLSPIAASARTACTRTACGCAASAAIACSAGDGGRVLQRPQPSRGERARDLPVAAEAAR